MIRIKTPDEIRSMRAAGQIVARTLRDLANAIVPGHTKTDDLDKLAWRLLKERGARPSFKGFRGYPKTLCVSVNEEVVHGIPGERGINEGDIVGMDLGASVRGCHADSAITVPVGQVAESAARLLQVAETSLWKGIEQAVPGKHVGDIGHAVQQYVEMHGYSVVRDLVGHGIGVSLQEEPQVPNFGEAGVGVVLREGMALAIEPMVNLGGPEVEVLGDGWTYVTRDRKVSAHFEHTVAITAEGPEILTLLPEEA